MYLTIIKNGITIDHRDYGIKLLSFKRNSLTPINEYETAVAKSGLNPISTTYDGRELEAVFFVKGIDHLDYQLLINDIYKIFTTEEEIYLIDSRQSGKRWKAKVRDTFGIENIASDGGRFTVNFLSSSPYAESIGTTLDSLTFDSELWQIGQGLISEDVKYIHNTNSFRIYNAGDVKVDPRVFSLIIKYKGASTNLQIKNNTTLETFSYTGATVPSVTLELNRLRALKNGVSIFGDTNRRSISLAPGWNDIELIGTSGSFEISFDFRFYYV